MLLNTLPSEKVLDSRAGDGRNLVVTRRVRIVPALGIELLRAFVC